MRNVLDVLPSAVTLMAFSLVALGIVLSPGPNMMYLYPDRSPRVVGPGTSRCWGSPLASCATSC